MCQLVLSWIHSMYKQNPIKLFCWQTTTIATAMAATSTPLLHNISKEEKNSCNSIKILSYSMTERAETRSVASFLLITYTLVVSQFHLNTLKCNMIFTWKFNYIQYLIARVFHSHGIFSKIPSHFCIEVNRTIENVSKYVRK